MRRVSLFLPLAVLLACGGGATPPSSPSGSSPETSSSAAPGSSAAPAGSSAAAPSGSAEGAPSMESQREPFMASCMKKVQAPDYCSCGWDQFTDVFKGADLNAQLAADDPRLQTLEQKTIALCGSKLPEDKIKASFLATCQGDEPKKAAYCNCAWPALRKTLAPADFLGSFQGQRFDDAKKAMVTACKGKFPAELAKADFMKECTRGDTGSTSRCECAWNKMRAKYPVEAIVSGTADISTVGLKDCK
ncbi:MAG TPA: hypothetical protein VMI75_01240 [Polyangiaceae bacterium]|nr:hypothetical protein [Polyangiaceae bacterium]